ncbi:ubiquitin family protein (macronuclear) [Tetrahymena thermophila SB210]|uniref:Ubiquitin family protein n=1 Tax=Tetrahymena thermophila (strain SB210) TaxID=312017 RepID=Q24GK5_TETTS|nr:ubiquitin family protein [Tetrahymena thermophila SB210]EAS06866.2 ubiquitin family protein [Tetrahymena thermophila SB210]|eukprot:XP_001027108.2 ubiquitin family protein [Tetrahymena thermophila SB210]
MIFNFSNANERVQQNNTFYNNTQPYNLTTLNFTINNNETSFANEQSYCLNRINNTLNNSAFIDDNINHNLDLIIQPSNLPSVIPSMNPTHRRFILSGNIQKSKNPNSNRLLSWNEEYQKLILNKEENDRFYFIKILNPFSQEVLDLDQEEKSQNLPDQGCEQQNVNEKTDDKNLNSQNNQTENIQNNVDVQILDNKQIENKKNVQMKKSKFKKNENKKKINANQNMEIQNKIEKQDNQTENDESYEEEKENICKHTEAQNIQIGQKNQENEIIIQQSYEKSKFESSGNDILINQNELTIPKQTSEKKKKIPQQQDKLSKILKNSAFQYSEADSPKSKGVNTLEKNKTQQKEMRRTLKEFFSYSDLIPIELKTTSKWKVSRLKRFLFSTELSSCKFAKLIYQGKELKDLDMIYDYKILPGHTIQAVLQKEEILSQFYTNSERRRLGLNQVFPQSLVQDLGDDPRMLLPQQNSGQNYQNVRQSSQIQQQLIREQQQRNIFSIMNQQGFDKLKDQHNISDKDIIVQRVYFHCKAQLARDNYQNMSDLMTREEKWLYNNFRKVDSYSKFRSYDFKKEQNFPYSQSFLRNMTNSNQESQNGNQENNQEKNHYEIFLSLILVRFQ